ncbi:MAG: transporter substrate-binding domain-containing protein [Hahellaceae bacterium]|nr:transporter substrate-binding domain-containing protein [Hahellaceae bacterium]
MRINMKLKTMAAAVALTFSGIAAAANYTLLTEELPPYSMKLGGKVTGASVDIVSELFRRSGLSFDVKLQPFVRAVDSTKNDANTCVFPVERNQEREVSFKWVSPILVTHTAFYTMNDSKVEIRVLNDAKKLSIGTYTGSAPAEYLSGQGFEVQTTPKDAPNIQKLAAKRIDVWAADTLTAAYLAKEAKVTNLKERLVYFSALRALACNLGTDDSVIDKLEVELKKMYADGSVEKILAKYK